MTLLDHYVRAVGMYLPGTPQKEDILTELAEHLRAKIDERVEEQGRPLTEAEQEQVLADHGDPETVARRYGGSNLGLAFGRQLIGPKVFPLYLRILLFQFALSIAVVFAVGFFVEQHLGVVQRYAVPLVGHFIVTTSIFIAIDALQRRSATPLGWSFPPSYRQPVPRWQSAAGLVVLGLFSAWWAAVPYAPVLLFGEGAGQLEFTAGWHAFYVPILLPLLAGTIQRAITFARPEWNWLQAGVRLVTNGTALALVYPIVQSFPYIRAVHGASAAAVAAADGLNALIWWSVLTGLSFYWLINAGFMLWLCGQQVLAVMRRRRERSPARLEIVRQ